MRLNHEATLGFTDTEHFGPTLRADTLSGGTAVLQCDLPGIGYLSFVSALEAIGFHVVYPQTFRRDRRAMRRC